MNRYSQAILLFLIACVACLRQAAGQEPQSAATPKSEAKAEKYDWNKLSFGGEGQPSLKRVRIKIVGDYDKTIFSIEIPEIDVELNEDATLRLVETALRLSTRQAPVLNNEIWNWQLLSQPIGELTLISDERTVVATIGYGFALDKQYKDLNSIFFSKPIAELIQLQVQAKTGRSLDARHVDRMSGKWLSDQNESAWKAYLKVHDQKK